MTGRRSEVAGPAAEVLLVRDLPPVLDRFQAEGVVNAADVHTAVTICRLAGEGDERVLLAVALVVRALRLGSVCLDLTSVAARTLSDSRADGPGGSDDPLPWPDPDEWRAACAASPAVSVGADGPEGRPLRLASHLLYLERYWRQEETVRRELLTRANQPLPTIDPERVRAAAQRLFAASSGGLEDNDLQRLVAAVAACSWITVLAGGPGTGKTTTITRVLALLLDQPGTRPRIALAAPTGKAAARLMDAVREASGRLDPLDRERLETLTATTVHRLLGFLPGARNRFAHHAGNHLPYDVVVVDEMSMVSLTLMARLLEATGPRTRLILVGDPDQLSSVEAGAVLADIVRAPSRPHPEAASQLAQLALSAVPSVSALGVVELIRPWRYGGGGAIDRLARAIRDSDADTALDVLRSGSEEVRWVPADVATERPSALQQVADHVRRQGRRTREAAATGDVTAAVQALDEHRLLCAHRTGPYGVTRWSTEAENWLTAAVPGYGTEGEWYLGRPVLVTANDYDLNVFNGDTGVVVETLAGRRVAFPRGSGADLIAPARLDDVQTVHAMTVHRAQGSQFGCVTFVVPPADSPLLTRELLYTAVSRATDVVQLIGTEDALRRAIDRPADRASGLRDRL